MESQSSSFYFPHIWPRPACHSNPDQVLTSLEAASHKILKGPRAEGTAIPTLQKEK